MINLAQSSEKLTKHFTSGSPGRLILGVVIFATLLGGVTGLVLANKGGGDKGAAAIITGTPKTPQQDAGTFRDFAEGVIQPKPEPKDPSEYTEGTHYLQRDGAVPIALTSSVVDLSQYEGKKVKIFGETQKALKEGWLMDVGKVEEIK